MQCVGLLGGGPPPPTALIGDHIEANKAELGVEPIYEQLQVAPSTYSAARSPPPSARSVTDAATNELIAGVGADDNGVDSARKVDAELRWHGFRRPAAASYG